MHADRKFAHEPTVPAPTLQTAQIAACERLEAAWAAGRPAPPCRRWNDLLPKPGEKCVPEHAFFLIEIDIEHRVKIGLAALLGILLPASAAERPRCSIGRCPAGRTHPLGVPVAWKNGERARRSDYQAAFPQQADALRDLRPRWTCPYAGVPSGWRTKQPRICAVRTARPPFG